MLQKYIFLLELNKLQKLIQKQFFFWVKGKINLETSNNPYRKSREKIVLKEEQKELKLEDFP